MLKLINHTQCKNLGNRISEANVVTEFILTFEITCKLQQLSTPLMNFYSLDLVCYNIVPKNRRTNCRGFFSAADTFFKDKSSGFE